MSRAWLVLFMGTMADTFFVDMIFNSVISVGGLVFLTGQQFHELIFRKNRIIQYSYIWHLFLL
jgi:hypothetical protein